MLRFVWQAPQEKNFYRCEMKDSNYNIILMFLSHPRHHISRYNFGGNVWRDIIIKSQENKIKCVALTYKTNERSTCRVCVCVCVRVRVQFKIYKLHTRRKNKHFGNESTLGLKGWVCITNVKYFLKTHLKLFWDKVQGPSSKPIHIQVTYTKKKSLLIPMVLVPRTTTIWKGFFYK